MKTAHCPHCSIQTDISAFDRGGLVACPDCHQEFEIPPDEDFKARRAEWRRFLFSTLRSLTCIGLIMAGSIFFVHLAMNHGDVALFLVVLALAGGFYFLPAWIADSNRHPRSMQIFAVNLLFGWTVLGWIAALIWAVSAHPPQTE